MAAPFRAGQALGFFVEGLSLSTFQTNAAANWFALSFIPDSGRTLSAVRAFVSSVTGSLASTDITCDLYDLTGASGSPGSSIETGKLPSATITASGWYDFTGFTTALTAGTQYWLVWKNVNGTPASNFATFRYQTGISPRYLFGSIVNRFSWGRGTSSNSGSTWTTQALASGLRVAYADGTYDGWPVSNNTGAAVGDGVYATRESGVKFTSPPSGVLKVAGLAMFVGVQTGTPTNALKLGLWTGSTPSNLAYTSTIPQTSQTTAQWVYAYFSSIQTLQPGAVTRVTLATSGSDTSAKRYANTEITWDTDSNSLILLPWEGTCVKTYYDGSTWTDTQGSIFGHALLLDTAGEFAGLPVGCITGARSIGTY